MDFAQKYGPYAIIAGASEGIGAAFARMIAERGVNCILISRRPEPLEVLADELRRNTGVECITASIDLSRDDAFEHIEKIVGDREIGLYVSNAGADWNQSYFLDKPMDAWFELLNLNALTAYKACHHFGQQMRERKRGGFLLVGSGACYSGGPFLASYSANKAFLLNFCQGLWYELKDHGVDVLYLVVKQTDTPAERRHYERAGLPMVGDFDTPEQVAEEGIARLAHGPVHNITLADDDPSFGLSAAAQRDRVLFVADAVKSVFGG